MVVLDVYRYGESFVRKFLRESTLFCLGPSGRMALTHRVSQDASTFQVFFCSKLTQPYYKERSTNRPVHYMWRREIVDCVWDCSLNATVRPTRTLYFAVSVHTCHYAHASVQPQHFCNAHVESRVYSTTTVKWTGVYTSLLKSKKSSVKFGSSKRCLSILLPHSLHDSS